MNARYSILPFALAFCVFLSYLIFTNAGYNLSAAIFWVSLVAMAAVLSYQILYLKISPSILLTEIFLFTLVLHFIISLPTAGLVGHDPHYEYSAAKNIQANGLPLSNDGSLPDRTINYSEWPLLQVLAIAVSSVTSLDLLFVAKFLAPIISSFAVLFIYLLSKTVYNDTRVALLISLTSSTVFWYVFFEARFVRESLAITLFFATLYLYVKAIKFGERKTYLLAIFSALVLVFSHHLTSIDLLIFVCVFAAVGLIYKMDWRGAKLLVKDSSFLNQRWLSTPVVFFALLLLIFNVAYWLYIGKYIPSTLALMANDLNLGFGYRYATSITGTSMRSTIASYGDIIVLAILGLIVLHDFFRSKRSKELFTPILFAMGFLMILIAYISPFIGPLSRIDFSRFVGFGFPFVLIVGMYALMKTRRKSIVAAFVIFFVCLQVFTIPAYFYDKTASPEYSTGGYREYYLPQEYRAVTWSNLTGKVVGDWSTYELFGGLGGINVYYESPQVVQIFKGNLSSFGTYDWETSVGYYDWLVFRQEDLLNARVGSARITPTFATTPETYQGYDYSVGLQKTYDNGEVQIYRILNLPQTVKPAS